MAVFEPHRAILEAKMAKGNFIYGLLGEVGGMAEALWLRQEYSEYSWSTEKSHTPAILSGCGGFIETPVGGPPPPPDLRATTP